MGKSNSKEVFEVDKNSQFTSQSSGVYRKFDQLNNWSPSKNGREKSMPLKPEKNISDYERIFDRRRSSVLRAENIGKNVEDNKSELVDNVEELKVDNQLSDIKEEKHIVEEDVDELKNHVSGIVEEKNDIHVEHIVDSEVFDKIHKDNDKYLDTKVEKDVEELEIIHKGNSNIEELENILPVEENKIHETSNVQDLKREVEVPEVKHVEELKNVDEIQGVKHVEELKNVDEIHELKHVGELKNVDEIQELKHVEELKNVHEIQELKHVEELKNVHEIEDTKHVEELKKKDIIEEILNVVEDKIEELENVTHVEVTLSTEKSIESVKHVEKHFEVTTTKDYETIENIVHVEKHIEVTTTDEKSPENVEIHVVEHIEVSPVTKNIDDDGNLDVKELDTSTSSLTESQVIEELENLVDEKSESGIVLPTIIVENVENIKIEDEKKENHGDKSLSDDEKLKTVTKTNN